MVAPTPTPVPVGTLIGAFPHNSPGKLDVIIESVLLALVFISLGLRLWSRKLQRAPLQVNDWLIIIAVPLMTARYVLEVTVMIKCGVGLHITEVLRIGGPGILVIFQKLVYGIDLLWVTLVSLVKLSILHFYLKVFRQTVFLRFAYAVIAITGAFWFGAFFGTAFFCNPPEKQWNPSVPGHCGDSNALYVSCATTDLCIDVLIILLPMPVLWSLQLPKAKKIALTFVFGLGFVIIAITAIRIKFMLELDYTDPTYSVSSMALLSAIVPLLGIVNANLPLMAPAYRRVFGNSSLSTNVKQSTATATSVSHSRNFERLSEPELPLKSMAMDSRGIYTPSQTDQIRVTTEWEVHMTGSSESDRNSTSKQDMNYI